LYRWFHLETGSTVYKTGSWLRVFLSLFDQRYRGYRTSWQGSEEGAGQRWAPAKSVSLIRRVFLPASNVTAERLVHASKASDPISFTDRGMQINVKAEQ
jgi:hypothetical protein